MADEQFANTQQQHQHHHRTDPSEGGWDTTITKANDSHKAGSRTRHRHAHEKSAAKKGLKGLGIVLLAMYAAFTVYQFVS